MSGESAHGKWSKPLIFLVRPSHVQVCVECTNVFLMRLMSPIVPCIQCLFVHIPIFRNIFVHIYVGVMLCWRQKDLVRFVDLQAGGLFFWGLPSSVEFLSGNHSIQWLTLWQNGMTFSFTWIHLIDLLIPLNFYGFNGKALRTRKDRCTCRWRNSKRSLESCGQE